MKNTLFIIPCCLTKIPGGQVKSPNYVDPLAKFVSDETYQLLENTRKPLMHLVKNEQYLPALDRYDGKLYTQKNMSDFKQIIRKYTNGENQPKLLILSALYGPLHPESLIDNYDLRMPQNGEPWMRVFPVFLKDYVVTNTVDEIRIFVGGDTGYYNVLEASIHALVEQGLLSKNKNIHYQVVDGGSSTTGPNHRRKLVELLVPAYPNLQKMFNRKIEENHL